MEKLTKSFSVLALGLGSLILATNVQAFDFGDMMNPSKWMGGRNNDRYSDYGPGPGYGYGGPGYGYGGPGYGYGGPGYGYGGPGYGYGGPGYGYGGYGGPGYGYGGPGYGSPGGNVAPR